MTKINSCRYWDKKGTPNVSELKSLLTSKGDASEKLRKLIDEAGMTEEVFAGTGKNYNLLVKQINNESHT